MNVLYDGIQELKVKIRQVADCFYQQKFQDGYRELVGIIDDIAAVLIIIDPYKDRPEISEDYLKLSNLLQEILAAMEQKDTVLMADILSYDIMDVMEKIRNVTLE